MRKYFIDTIIFFVIFNVLFLLCFMVKCKICKNKYSIKDIIKKQFLYVYIFTLFSQTVLPYWRFDMDKFELIILPFQQKSINCIPFRTLYNYIFESNTNVDSWSMVALVNVLGNIALFVPIGFVLQFQKKKTFKVTIVIGFLITGFIEVIQYFIGRVSDVDDLIMNMLGVCIGYAVAKHLDNYIRLRLGGGKNYG